jgi:quercetin dioxygenase-like cupin family protein
MRIRLAPGESLPPHNANSEVLLVPLVGAVRFASADRVEDFAVGEALSVPYQTPMDVSNPGAEPAVFLVVKAPHPKTRVGK